MQTQTRVTNMISASKSIDRKMFTGGQAAAGFLYRLRQSPALAQGWQHCNEATLLFHGQRVVAPAITIPYESSFRSAQEMHKLRVKCSWNPCITCASSSLLSLMPGQNAGVLQQ